jgi:hypothetical protein
MADGEYPSYAFDDTETEKKTITIIKATETNHGSNIGWRDIYGDEVAKIGPIQFKRSYYTFNGTTGGGRDNWDNVHGFRINVSSGGYAIIIGDPYGSANERVKDRTDIKISNIEIFGNRTPCTNIGGAGIHLATGAIGHTNISLSHLWIHDIALPIHGAKLNGAILEDSLIERQASSSTCHSEGWAAWGPNNDIIVRNNIFKDIEGTAFIATDLATNWTVYNNIFMCTQGRPYSCGVGNGVIGTTDHTYETTSGWRIHHNNFINIVKPFIDLDSPNGPPSKDNFAYNNIFFLNTRVAFSGVQHDYNWFFQNENGDNLSEENGEIGKTDPFIDWTQDDFNLKISTKPGTNLPDFNTDPQGRTRGADGNWDRGAYEYIEPDYIPGDVNGDGIVNIQDIAAIIADFSKTSEYFERADQNNDGTINLFDIMVVIRNWGGL